MPPPTPVAFTTSLLVTHNRNAAAPVEKRRHTVYHVARPRAAAQGAQQNAGAPQPVNVNKYKSQRSILSGEKRDVNAEQVNALMIKAGRKPRDITKWKQALKGSYIVVSARLLSTSALVGFARATSDRALNGTIWDVVADPDLPDAALMKRNVVKYLLKELRRTVPGCSIALFSGENDRPLYEDLDFVADPDGIQAMALIDPEIPHTL